MFSADYWHAQTLLDNEIKRLREYVVKAKPNLYPYLVGTDYGKLDAQDLRHFAIEYVRKCHFN